MAGNGVHEEMPLRRAVMEAGDLAVVDIREAEAFFQRALQVLDRRYQRRWDKEEGRGVLPALELGRQEVQHEARPHRVEAPREERPVELPTPENQLERLMRERRSQGQKHRYVVAGLRKELTLAQMKLAETTKELERVKLGMHRPTRTLGRVIAKSSAPRPVQAMAVKGPTKQTGVPKGAKVRKAKGKK